MKDEEKAEKYVRDRRPFQFTYSVGDDEQYAKDVKQAYIDGFKEGTIEAKNISLKVNGLYNDCVAALNKASDFITKMKNTLNIGKNVQEENVFLNFYGFALKDNEYPLPLTKDSFFELFIVLPGFFSVVLMTVFSAVGNFIFGTGDMLEPDIKIVKYSCILSSFIAFIYEVIFMIVESNKIKKYKYKAVYMCEDIRFGKQELYFNEYKTISDNTIEFCLNNYPRKGINTIFLCNFKRMYVNKCMNDNKKSFFRWKKINIKENNKELKNKTENLNNEK